MKAIINGDCNTNHTKSLERTKAGHGHCNILAPNLKGPSEFMKQDYICMQIYIRD